MKSFFIKTNFFFLRIKLTLINFNSLIILFYVIIFNLINNNTVMCSSSEEQSIISQESPTSVGEFQSTLEITRINIQQIYLDTVDTIDVDLQNSPRRRFSVAQHLYDSYHFLSQIIQGLQEFFSWNNNNNDINTAGGRMTEIENIAEYWERQPSPDINPNFSEND